MKIMVSCDTKKNIALVRLPVTSAPDKKNNRGRVGHSQSGEGQLQESGQGIRIFWEAAKVTRPQCKTSHDDHSGKSAEHKPE